MLTQADIAANLAANKARTAARRALSESARETLALIRSDLRLPFHPFNPTEYDPANVNALIACGYIKPSSPTFARLSASAVQSLLTRASRAKRS